MHRLDIVAEVRSEVPHLTDPRRQFNRLDRYDRPTIYADRILCLRRLLVPIERGVNPRDGRPCLRVGGRFAGKVAGIEFGEGAVDVVGVERDDRDDPLVGVDLADAERLYEERLRFLITVREPYS
jgi:hypothetical protein